MWGTGLSSQLHSLILSLSLNPFVLYFAITCEFTIILLNFKEKGVNLIFTLY